MNYSYILLTRIIFVFLIYLNHTVKLCSRNAKENQTRPRYPLWRESIAACWVPSQSARNMNNFPMPLVDYVKPACPVCWSVVGVQLYPHRNLTFAILVRTTTNWYAMGAATRPIVQMLRYWLVRVHSRKLEAVGTKHIVNLSICLSPDFVAAPYIDTGGYIGKLVFS